MEIGPDRWRDRVPDQYRDRAPRLIRLPDGGDAILTENQPLLVLHAHNVTLPPEEWGLDRPFTYEGAIGAGSPEQRLKEQDVDGVDAEVLFAGVSGQGLWNRIQDDNAYYAIVRAYNDFLAEDYMAADPERLLCMALIPQRGVEGAIAEMERCAKLGFKGVCIFTYPAGRPMPTPEDDRFWAAALDLEMPITIHTQFRERGENRGPDLGRRIATYGVKGAPIASSLAVHGVFARFPRLQIYIAENQICWIPGFLEQMDILWGRHRFYHERLQDLKPLDRKPSEYVRDHVHWGFMDDPIGVQFRHHIGVDHVMWSTDFPHDPSDWPHSQDTITREFAGVPEHEKQQIIAGNAVRFFHLDALPAEDAMQERVANAV